MTLAEYLKKSGQTRTSIATRIGVTPSFITQIIAGNKRPALETALDIASVTGGAVPVTIWDRRPEAEKPT